MLVNNLVSTLCCWYFIMLAHYVECHYAECHYAECHYAECHYAECHYAEWHFAECGCIILTNVISPRIAVRANVIHSEGVKLNDVVTANESIVVRTNVILENVAAPKACLRTTANKRIFFCLNPTLAKKKFTKC